VELLKKVQRCDSGIMKTLLQNHSGERMSRRDTRNIARTLSSTALLRRPAACVEQGIQSHLRPPSDAVC